MMNLNKKPIDVIIAARRGVMQKVLKATLADLPWLQIVALADENELILPAIQAENPRLLMLDSDLVAYNISALIQQIKNDHPKIRCLVLTQTTKQQAQALTSGADVVFPHSGSVTALRYALEDLFPRRETTF